MVKYRVYRYIQYTLDLSTLDKQDKINYVCYQSFKGFNDHNKQYFRFYTKMIETYSIATHFRIQEKWKKRDKNLDLYLVVVYVKQMHDKKYLD